MIMKVKGIDKWSLKFNVRKVNVFKIEFIFLNLFCLLCFLFSKLVFYEEKGLVVFIDEYNIYILLSVV